MKNIGYSLEIECGHCPNTSRMKILEHHGDITTNDQVGFEYGTVLEILKCPVCHKYNIISYRFNDFCILEEEGYKGFERLYPEPQNIPIGLPQRISELYRKAEQVKNIDVDAYAVLLRKLLEAICIDRKAETGTLHTMLMNLEEKGEIPKKLVDVANGLREFGNIGAHFKIEKLSNEEIPLLDSLIKAILEYVYTAPHIATVAEKKLSDLKKTQQSASTP